ncbi:LysR family transcriptional regulator [Lactobacillus delbrueckii]|jgi:DNA-binding transcriptional LysR family regulator|nr:LysR family transcriptional regulator [Lactobacillus delbrueckii]
MAQAAEKLGISQPTLSYAVKKLEEKAATAA